MHLAEGLTVQFAVYVVLSAVQLATARAELKDLREKYLKTLNEQNDALTDVEKAEQRASEAENNMRALQVRVLAGCGVLQACVSSCWLMWPGAGFTSIIVVVCSGKHEGPTGGTVQSRRSTQTSP